nr:reverse transcriptase domain-containing protein [Tanacetum cinerariifolium]
MEKEDLIVYLAAEKEVVSAVLITKREAKQMPVYFVSRVLQGPEINYTPMEKLGTEFTYALRFRFDATNNEAEYEALITDLRIVDQMEKVKTLAGNFKKFSIKQVPRSKNKKADALSKIASTSFAHMTKQVLVEELNEKSINKVEVLAIVEEEGDTWMTPIYEYLTKETLLTEQEKERDIRRKSRWYAVINGVPFNKSYLGQWLRCIGPLQENYVLREIHEGSCSMHAGTRSVLAKAIRTGYY